MWSSLLFAMPSNDQNVCAVETSYPENQMVEPLSPVFLRSHD